MGEASVIFNGVTTHLTADQILIIPPNTPFSTRLKGVTENDQNERHIRKKISDWSELGRMKYSQSSDQLFIHFNLGNPYDLIEPGVYACPVEENEKEILNQIKDFCMNGSNVFDFRISAVINSLLLGFLKVIPQEKWEMPKMDLRVSRVVAYIERHPGERLTNKLLSEKANMVENSFARLFRENVGISIQQYIKKKRIDKALIMLHHSTSSIDDIAIQCGFSDRFHFSKVFKERMGKSPATYKKQMIN